MQSHSRRTAGCNAGGRPFSSSSKFTGSHKKALNHELPATIKIPHNDEPEESRETDKKIAQDVDNSSNYSKTL